MVGTKSSGPPVTRAQAHSAHLTLTAAVLAEIENARAAGQLDSTKIGPRCHVCCEVESKKLVNSLLAAGLTNREITECCEAINARRKAKGDKRVINAKNVWMHRRTHFDIDRPSMATYREIMERRAAEANQDYINGIGHAITPYAVLETVMVKGYKHVTDDDTPISTREAMESAQRLHEMTKSDAGSRKMADLLFTMDRIIAAAQEFIPPEQQQAFLARVEGQDAPPRPSTMIAEHAEAIREFSPSAKVDEEDEI